MTAKDKELILDLALGKLTEQHFFNKFQHSKPELPAYINCSLQEAILERNADKVEYALLVLFHFDLYDTSLDSLICQLLLENWHYKHEDLVSLVQSEKIQICVNAVYETAIKSFDYLAYDTHRGLSRKCTWALAEIGTEAAYSKLRELANSENSLIRSYAEKRLANPT